TRRELSAYFYSPVAYIVLLGVTIIAWLTFAIISNALLGAAQETRTAPPGSGVALSAFDFLLEPVVEKYLNNRGLALISLLFMLPIITMLLFSEEKRSGTMEVLLTAPVKDVWVVLSKFFAAWIFFMLTMLPYGMFLIALRAEGGESFDYRPLLSFSLALAFI